MKTKPILENPTLDTITSPNTMLTTFIQTLVDNYRNTQLTAINAGLGIDDAHSIWFDLGTLKKFVADIECEAQKVDANISENDLGVRFYYAAYPTVANWGQMANQTIEQEYAGKHTLVMVPTLRMEDELGEPLNYDFNPLDPATYSKSNNPDTNKVMALSSDSSLLSDALAQNHGQLIPPSDPKVETY